MNNIKNIILKPINQHKKITTKYCKKFYDLPKNTTVKTEIIKWNEKMNLNNEILLKYKNEPHLFIIQFGDEPNIKFTKIPIYPVFYKDNFYISPINIEYINGFSNQYNNKEILISDFLNRIYRQIGAIFVINDFNINISTHDNTGIHDLKSGILTNSNINNIPSWMVSYVPTNDFGWFSPMNVLAIDYVMENYDINTIAEFGIYMGKSTKYIANYRPNSNYYCFDLFDNLFLTQYHSDKINPEDTEFFFQYLRFDTFHSNLKNFKNIYSIKGDNYLGPNILKNNNINNIDLIYIDFIKQDVKLIDFVNQLFDLYPNAIIIGDDVVHLNFSMDYFEKKYNFIKMDTCYICMKDRKWNNKHKLLNKIKEIKEKYEITSSSLIKKENNVYQYDFICRKIGGNEKYEKINEYLVKLDKNPNYLCDDNNNNIYHYIAFERNKNKPYYYGLYNYLIKIYPDENCKNTLNMSPQHYFSFNGPFFK